MHSKYDNMHRNRMFYALICINSHEIKSICCMLSVVKSIKRVEHFFLCSSIAIISSKDLIHSRLLINFQHCHSPLSPCHFILIICLSLFHYFMSILFPIKNKYHHIFTLLYTHENPHSYPTLAFHIQLHIHIHTSNEIRSI